MLAEQGGVLRLVGVAPSECIAASRTAPDDDAFLIYDALPIGTCTALRAESL